MQRSVRRPALCPGGLPAEIRLIRGNLLVDVHAIRGLAADRNTANAVLGDGGEYLAHTVKSPHRYPVAGRRQGRRLSATGYCRRAFSAWNRILRPRFKRRRLLPAGAAAVVCTLRNAGIICMASLFFYFSYKYTFDLLYPYMLGDVKYFRENRSLIHIFQHAFIV